MRTSISRVKQVRQTVDKLVMAVALSRCSSRHPLDHFFLDFVFLFAMGSRLLKRVSAFFFCASDMLA